MKKLEKNLSVKIFDKIARATKFIQRRKKYGAHSFFWSVTGGFCVGQAAEIAGMLRAFIKDTGIDIQYNAWYNRLSKDGFPEFMRESYCHLLNHLYAEHLPIKGKLLEEFSDILMQDGSSFAVNDLMRKYYPGRFTKISPAAVELHIFYSLRYASVQHANLAPDSVSEYQFMPTAKDADLKDTLNLFDRGYGSIDRLHLIEQENGYFICRMKDNINPLILSAYGKNNKTINQFFKNITLKKKRDYDFYIQFKNDKIFKNLRVIALWNRQTKKHVLFLTNTSGEQLSLKEVGKLYRLRWQIELFFKELKSHTELRKFLTGNHNIAEGFIWAALCALLIRRFLVATVQQISGKRLSFHKAAISARTFMPEFIACALFKFHDLGHCLLNTFRYIQKTMTFSNPHKLSALQLAGVIL